MKGMGVGEERMVEDSNYHNWLGSIEKKGKREGKRKEEVKMKMKWGDEGEEEEKYDVRGIGEKEDEDGNLDEEFYKKAAIHNRLNT